MGIVGELALMILGAGVLGWIVIGILAIAMHYPAQAQVAIDAWRWLGEHPYESMVFYASLFMSVMAASQARRVLNRVSVDAETPRGVAISAAKAALLLGQFPFAWWFARANFDVFGQDRPVILDAVSVLVVAAFAMGAWEEIKRPELKPEQSGEA